MQDDWKSNIGEFFTKQGIYRLKFMNQKLFEYFTEYMSYLNEFHGIHARTDRVEHLGSGLWDINLYINFHLNYTSKLHEAGFILQGQFNETGNLLINYSTGYNWAGRINATIKSKDEDVDFHSYKEEELTGPEILEKEYIFQLINQRLMNYVEAVNRK